MLLSTIRFLLLCINIVIYNHFRVLCKTLLADVSLLTSQQKKRKKERKNIH